MFGGSSGITAPSSIRNAPFPVSGAVILALLDPEEAISWCKECCVGRWSYETADFEAIQLGTLTVPVFCFYFTHKADVMMFTHAYPQQMRLALEVLEA